MPRGRRKAMRDRTSAHPESGLHQKCPLQFQRRLQGRSSGRCHPQKVKVSVQRSGASRGRAGIPADDKALCNAAACSASPSRVRPTPPARTEPADSDCRASICCRGWCGLRSRPAWARVPTRRRSRPLENPSPVPIAATMALEMIGPMPGTLIRRSHPASRLASSSSSPDRPSMRSSSQRQSEVNSSMTRTMRGESTSGGVAKSSTSVGSPPLCIFAREMPLATFPLSRLLNSLTNASPLSSVVRPLITRPPRQPYLPWRRRARRGASRARPWCRARSGARSPN